MKRVHKSLALAPLLLILVPLWMQEKEPDKADLTWLAGHWGRVSEGIDMEEAWLAPKGKLMLGVHRDVLIEQDRTLSFEYLRIEQRKDSVVYIASPSGGKATEFTLVSGDKHSATFENPEHDFPQRIIYRRVDDTLHARIEGSGEQSMEWQWDLKP